MKRIILSVLTMSALLCGCQKDHVSELAQGRGTIQATIEEISSTRTVMDEDNNIRWSEGDQIVGFMRSTLGVKYQVTAASVGKTSASFEEVSSGGLNAGTELEHIIAYYPYSSSVSAAKSGSNYTLDVILPTEQTYVAESFGHGAMPMVAVSETNNITFRNICGGMKLQLKGTQKIASIKVEGKNGELLSGSATVTAYTDETKPAITMASGASTSVTLNCGEGVQLNENTVTEFIMALPPTVFTEGFIITVTNSNGGTQIIETSKLNTVWRSSLLVMPTLILKDTIQFIGDSASSAEISGATLEEVTDGLLYDQYKEWDAPIYHLTYRMMGMPMRISIPATAVIYSPNPYVKRNIFRVNNLNYDETIGRFDFIEGGVDIYMNLEEGSASTYERGNILFYNSDYNVVLILVCTLDLSDISLIDYIDEYSINHGQGVEIDGVVWAPVNCGYHATDYKYGKLYQWGRKHGQGYDGSLYDVDMNEIGTYSDAIIPIIDDGGISEISGQHSKNSNVYYAGNSDSDYDWVYPPNPDLWNSGTESSPIKADGDPCPSGWRVPTASELDILSIHRSSMVSQDGMNGYWFSGEKEYTEDAPRVFLCAAGRRETQAVERGKYCFYWSSTSHPGYYYGLAYHMGTMGNSNYMHKHMFLSERDAARSVRCVQE